MVVHNKKHTQNSKRKSKQRASRRLSHSKIKKKIAMLRSRSSTSAHTTDILYNTYFEQEKKDLDALGLYLFGISRGFVESLTAGFVLPSLTKGTYYKSLSKPKKNVLKKSEYMSIGHNYKWFYKHMGLYLKQKKKNTIRFIKKTTT